MRTAGCGVEADTSCRLGQRRSHVEDIIESIYDTVGLRRGHDLFPDASTDLDVEASFWRNLLELLQIEGRRAWWIWVGFVLWAITSWAVGAFLFSVADNAPTYAYAVLAVIAPPIAIGGYWGSHRRYAKQQMWTLWASTRGFQPFMGIPGVCGDARHAHTMAVDPTLAYRMPMRYTGQLPVLRAIPGTDVWMPLAGTLGGSHVHLASLERNVEFPGATLLSTTLDDVNTRVVLTAVFAKLYDRATQGFPGIACVPRDWAAPHDADLSGGRVELESIAFNERYHVSYAEGGQPEQVSELLSLPFLDVMSQCNMPIGWQQIGTELVVYLIGDARTTRTIDELCSWADLIIERYRAETRGMSSPSRDRSRV